MLAPESTRIQFTNRVSDAALAANQILELGSGVALGDADGDGWTDIYLCAIEGGNRLYRNLGHWVFADITSQAGVACAGQASTGAVLADVDGDGDLDLLVNSLGGGTRLFLNRGDATFQELADAGLKRAGGASSLALADFNGDGALDLYVAYYHEKTFKDSSPPSELKAGYVDGKFVVSPPGLYAPLFLKSGGVSLFELGQPDVLYLNNGRGRFVPQSWTNGVFLDEKNRPLPEAPVDWGLAVMARDLNGDGRPDLYVCNDFFGSPDRIWMNRGQGTFQAVAPSALRHTSMSSMSVDAADLDQDGHDDLLVVDMMSREHQRRQRQRGSLIQLQAAVPTSNPDSRPEYPRNMLFRSRGDGSYAEIARLSGLEATEWTWSVVFLDVDLDGYDDVLLTTGNLRDANDADLTRPRRRNTEPNPAAPRTRPKFPRLESPLLAFHNEHNWTFQERGREWGFDTVGVAHGMALADLDNDGDLDVVVNAMHRGVGLFRNESAAPRLAVHLRGEKANTRGIGARITVTGGAVPSQRKEVTSGGRYLSGDDSVRVFAAGSQTNRLRVTVDWPGGKQSSIPEVPSGSRVEIWEAQAGPPLTAVRPPAAPPLFENVSDRLRHPHQATEYDEAQRQPLLPRQLSTGGPGVAWYDFDGDGWEDLMVGSGRGSPQVLYLSDHKGSFKPMRRRELATNDQSGLLGWKNAAGQTGLLVGSSANRDPDTNASSLLQIDLEKDGTTKLPFAAGDVGPLALGVVDGRRVLFAGGRAQPGRYPEAASSLLYVEEPAGWQIDRTRSPALENIGLVNGAVWTDINGDGRLELALACEWGPIRIFQFANGVVKDLTDACGLGELLGLWTSVATGDFDGDGRLDLIAGNWGENTRYERHLRHPIRVYYGDPGDRGRTEILEAYFDDASRRYVPFATLDLLREQWPETAARFPTFQDYARAGIDEILGEARPKFRFHEVRWLASTLFLNRGGRFVAHRLPLEAQVSPGFGITVGDADGDGREDVFLAQNFFGVEPDDSRQDAGQGLWLRGLGDGQWQALSGSESGVVLTGEQRGAALCDYDHDGRADLVVGQHRGRFGLFHNTGGRPGLRVKLAGLPGNPDAIGAVIRLNTARGLGPARIVGAGSGHYSQDALVQVMGLATDSVKGVWVRWPGGRETLQVVATGTREVTVEAPK